MQQPPLSDAEAEALADFVEPFVCPIQVIPKDDKQQPPGYQFGTGWLFDRQGMPCIVTCEHVAREQSKAHLAYSCVGGDSGISVGGQFHEVPFPIDGAIASIRKTFRELKHNGECVPDSLIAASHKPVDGELFYAYGFPGVDAKQAFETQIAQGTGVFLREVELDTAVFQEPLPHPTDIHICLAWRVLSQ